MRWPGWGGRKKANSEEQARRDLLAAAEAEVERARRVEALVSRYGSKRRAVRALKAKRRRALKRERRAPE
jgi:hypothetical protein